LVNYADDSIIFFFYPDRSVIFSVHIHIAECKELKGVKQFYFFEEYADSMFLKKKTFTCCFSREGF